MKTIIKIRFKNLKQNYLEVAQFIKNQSSKEKFASNQELQ